jgi:amino acid adenylation domain-containing protein/thioester reductase-like protein
VSSDLSQTVRKTLALSSEVVQRIEQLSADEGVPRKSLFVAAVVALLARYAGRDDISLVVHANGRARLIQVRLDGGPDSKQLLRRTWDALDVAARVDDVRAEQIVPGATSGRDVVVTLDTPDASFAGDLMVHAQRHSVQLLFRAERFENDAMTRIAEHLRALIAGLVDGAGPVSTIPIVHGEERAWVLARSNASTVKLDETLPSIVECFERHARGTPAAMALVDANRELTYRQLDEAANALCERLRATGIGPGMRVAMYLERGANAIIVFLAILKARATYVPIDTSYPAGRVTAILECAAPSLVVTCASCASAVAAFSKADKPVTLLLVDSVQDIPSAAPIASPRPPVQPDDAAYTFFTSGSTGQPKGVVVDHRSLANYVRAAFDAYGVRAGDRVLQTASLGFDLSLEEIIITLTAGAALVVRSARPIESVQSFFEECVEQRLTVLSITSALWHELTMRLADGTVALPPALRLVILGADAARPDVLVPWQRATGGRVRLVNTYGLTETTIVATVWEAGDQTLPGDWRVLPIGRPLRNVSAYVLDSSNELVPVGLAGEICIGGLAVARGYLGDDALTRARFLPDPFLPGGWMYRSGDRGILRSTGELEFLGRADYQIKIRGVRIELGEIESRLREHSGVVEAIVVAQKNKAGEMELDAHVMVSSHAVTTAQLRAHLERVLPAAAVPARMHVVDRFPLTPAGKIDRRALAAATAPAERPQFVAPQTPLQKLVATTTAEVLGMESVGLQDGFLALGGTSLSAVRAASVLGPRLGRRLRAQLFLEFPTLADVCAELERSDVEPRDPTPLLRQVEKDAILASDIVVTSPAGGPAPLASVLLTGATGYYGTFVLDELLRATQAHVVCLVRAKSPEAARARTVANLVRRGCSVDPAVLASRLSFLCADVAEPAFGLAPETFRSLSERIDAVFHVAAHVSMLLPYDAVRASNALAVEWVLRLATTGRPKTVHHVSTVEVLVDTDRRAVGALSERLAASSPARLESGYGQSKWVAEKLIEQARKLGVRAYVHRAGRLTGHSATGAFNDDDFLVHLLDACGRIGAAPVLDVYVDMTPVDAASRALVRLAKTEPAGETFHLVHPKSPTWGYLVEIAVGLGYPLRFVTHSKWRSLLNDVTLGDQRPTFLHYLASLSQDEIEASLRGGYEAKATHAALGPRFDWPPLDARLVATYLRALSDAGRFELGTSPRRLASAAPGARASGRMVAGEIYCERDPS